VSHPFSMAAFRLISLLTYRRSATVCPSAAGKWGSGVGRESSSEDFPRPGYQWGRSIVPVRVRGRC